MRNDLSPITWNDSFSVGVVTLDEHHRHLARLINQLTECLGETSQSEKLVDILNALVLYAEYHFRHEEALMTEAAYADLDEHRKEHLQFCEVIAETCYGVTLGIVATETLFSYLSQWWRNHILLEDMKYKPVLAGIAMPHNIANHRHA